MNRLSVTTASKAYDIVFYNHFDALVDEIKKLNISISKILIITDDIVDSLYGEEVEAILKDYFTEVYRTVFLHGEKSKNLSVISEFYSCMIEHQLDRKSLVVALGGGVVGDMAGFAAATYMRGIKFIQVPTTLLSQVDSSVGGKTGVDFNGYKNIVGAFCQPELVYINIATLESLPDNEFNSGMAEVIKHGLILDKNYLEDIENKHKDIKNLNKEVMTYIIRKSCEIKSMIVSEDEKEEGRRALLNFGHTVGHAVERLKNFELLHGECVAIGMISALYISKQLGYIKEEEIVRVVSLLEKFNLPINVGGLTTTEIYQEMFHDKKTANNQLNFVLLEELGESYINKGINQTVVLDAIDKIIK